MLKITEGTVNRALKVVIYGSEGIGKTTIASKFPNPLFIDTEGGTSQLNVRRIDRPKTWEELCDIIKEVAANPEVCKTLVLDTADWAERLAVDKVCREHQLRALTTERDMFISQKSLISFSKSVTVLLTQESTL